jgi:DoxX-like family
LTPLAAACLALLMLGAVVLGLRMGDPVGASMPGVVGLLAAFVAWGRWRLAPGSQTEPLRELQAAS